MYASIARAFRRRNHRVLLIFPAQAHPPAHQEDKNLDRCRSMSIRTYSTVSAKRRCMCSLHVRLLHTCTCFLHLPSSEYVSMIKRLRRKFLYMCVHSQVFLLHFHRLSRFPHLSAYMEHALESGDIQQACEGGPSIYMY